MKKILFLALGCSLLFTPSCKDFLQKDNPYDPTEATFWQSKTDFDLALTGIYAQLRGGSYYRQSVNVASNFLTTFLSSFDNFTDNASGGTNNYAGQNEYLRDVITPENMPGLIGAAYDYCYAAIERINIFIDKLEIYYPNKEDADYKKFKGEAVALRGLMYHYLYTCYGAVPVVKEALAYDDGVGIYKEKSSKEEVYKAVIEDYDEAIAKLSDGVNYKDANFHITADAVRAFRARTRLYHAYDENGVAVKAEMAEILTELNQITASYSLADDILDNFHSSAQSASPEIMFSLRFLKPTFRNQIDLLVGDWKTIQPTRSLVFAFPNADGSEFVVSDELKTKEKLTDADYKELFTDRDPRLSKSVTYGGIYDFTDYGGGNAVNAGTTVTGFNVYKLVTPIANGGSWNNGYRWQGDQDVVLMRWAHVLLMKAEAAFESAGANAALPYINELRTHYGVGTLSDITQEQLRNEIRIETCFEGLRYFDMKRWRILSTMNGQKQDPASNITVVVNPAHFDWPIPYEEIRQAKDPGYNNPTGN